MTRGETHLDDLLEPLLEPALRRAHEVGELAGQRQVNDQPLHGVDELAEVLRLDLDGELEDGRQVPPVGRRGRTDRDVETTRRVLAEVRKRLGAERLDERVNDVERERRLAQVAVALEDLAHGREELQRGRADEGEPRRVDEGRNRQSAEAVGQSCPVEAVRQAQEEGEQRLGVRDVCEALERQRDGRAQVAVATLTWLEVGDFVAPLVEDRPERRAGKRGLQRYVAHDERLSTDRDEQVVEV